MSLRAHRAGALARCAEALALVIRDVAHVTPHSCRAAVRAVRLLAAATLHAGQPPLPTITLKSPPNPLNAGTSWTKIFFEANTAGIRLQSV